MACFQSGTFVQGAGNIVITYSNNDSGHITAHAVNGRIVGVAVRNGDRAGRNK